MAIFFHRQLHTAIERAFKDLTPLPRIAAKPSRITVDNGDSALNSILRANCCTAFTEVNFVHCHRNSRSKFPALSP
jgi:hypothetical protein